MAAALTAAAWRVFAAWSRAAAVFFRVAAAFLAAASRFVAASRAAAFRVAAAFLAAALRVAAACSASALRVAAAFLAAFCRVAVSKAAARWVGMVLTAASAAGVLRTVVRCVGTLFAGVTRTGVEVVAALSRLACASARVRTFCATEVTPLATFSTRVSALRMRRTRTGS